MPISLKLIKRFLIFCSKYLMHRYAEIGYNMSQKWPLEWPPKNLVNWTRAEPGTYGADTPKRFFRVRAVVKP